MTQKRHRLTLFEWLVFFTSLAWFGGGVALMYHLVLLLIEGGWQPEVGFQLWMVFTVFMLVLGAVITREQMDREKGK